MLSDLHETQENEGSGELATLIEELESWKKESHRLLDETRSWVADVEDQTTQELGPQRDAKASDIVKAIESQISGRFGSLDRRVSEIVETVCSWHNSSPKWNPKSNDPNLDTIDLLGQQSQDLQAKSERFSEQFDEKTDRVLKSAKELTDQFEQRFDKLNDHVNKITSALEGQQAILESSNASVAESDSWTLNQFDQKIETIVLAFNSRIDELFGDLGNRISQFSESIARTEPSLEVPAPANVKCDDSASHWHRQKEAMLSKYGIDPDYRPLSDGPKNPTEAAESNFELAETSENLESLQKTIENISAEDAEAVENLKEELTSKLRDAEVEFSISRAKHSQFKAELDGRQIELDRRAAELNEQYSGSSSSGKKSGFLDRLARHLSLKQPKQLGD